MNVLLFFPYGANHHERSSVVLLAAHLRSRGISVTQLLCNGVFSSCGRDRETQGVRNLDTCAQCIAEQREFAPWMNIGLQDISPFLSSKESEEIRDWVLGLKGEELKEVKFHGIELFQRCERAFKGKESDTLKKTSSYEGLIRHWYVNVCRLIAMTDHVLGSETDFLCITSKNEDTLTEVFAQRAEGLSVPVAKIRWDMGQRSVVISDSRRATQWNTPLFFDEVALSREDLGSLLQKYEQELVQITQFLGFSSEQLSLPIGYGRI